MNAKQRKKIETAKQTLETVRDENQDAYDNMTEGLQQTARGEDITSAIEYLDEAITALEQIT